MKKLLKKIIPPILFDIYRSIKPSPYGWKGNYKTWEDAQNDATGYDADEILEKVRNSLLKVKNGEAVYERDSVIFDKIEYSWPLLSGLMLAAAKNKGNLNVLDFGGSLGSTYFQNKKFLDPLANVSWNIVEQIKFVEIGKKEFESNNLHFYYDIENCIKEQSPNILLLSSILQYLEKPYQQLDELLRHNFQFIFIDLTAVSFENERITVQHVPPSIYSAKYPCWILDYNKINLIFEKNNYLLIEQFESLNNFKIIDKSKIIGHYIGELRVKNG
ncbi:MAG: methyltransferase, TIGR04325 family [Leptospiraceae bacterium]|nr:methyltransferase, TIGR04325 family [Leptospiraceae bacterium]